MLFILVMEPLRRLLDLGTERGVLSHLRPKAARFRTSMYADDAALFLNPIKEEVCAVRAILDRFGEASGLKINP